MNYNPLRDRNIKENALAGDPAPDTARRPVGAIKAKDHGLVQKSAQPLKAARCL